MENLGFLSINLNRLRKEKGFSLQKLAEISGLSVQTLHSAESKGRPLRTNNLTKLAKALGVEPIDLLREPFTKEQAPQPTLDERILSEIRRATQESIQDAFKDQAIKNGREYVPSVMDSLQTILKDLPEHKLQSLLEYALKIKNPPKRQA
ncbi:HipB Predicted transcriptional regulators [uncultured Caudovirales phage]|uniref:HipB Predicted transcriptional regulators n=1 Tax=uncultured Caudovirales phage TaxID=2100421 RepID=A0A6J5N2K3_9CAUD|nr:HipB Predicted transcriptional regulators [uncultured Caudovirales phage]